MKVKAFFIVLRDVLLFGALLAAFMLVHHILPHVYDPVRNIVGAPEETSGEPEPAPETDTVPGDFSAAFPDTDTGIGADYSYQMDDLRIAVSMVRENGVAYFAANVWVKNIELVKTAFASDGFSSGVTASVRRMAKENGAILAVSGDFCGAHRSGTVIRNGVLYREENGDKDVCVLYYDGTMKVYTADEFSVDKAVTNSAWQAWSFGPGLLENGRAVTEFRSSVARANPRCAIGYYEPGHYCLVIVDGRQEGYSTGMTLAGLSALMEKLGCEEAYNLDGGATAEMVYDGETISSPSNGGRASSDIIYFAKEGD